jgi:phage N-6-adenine-methyltransferase
MRVVRIPKGRPLLPPEAKTVEHETPPNIFDPLNEEFGFTLDAAAASENTKCEQFFSMENSGLINSWRGHKAVWLNPPYNVKSLIQFTAKALAEVLLHDLTVVLLVPCKTDQKWFQDLWKEYKSEYSLYNIDFRWVDKRIKFLGNEHAAGFANAVVVIEPWSE